MNAQAGGTLTMRRGRRLRPILASVFGAAIVVLAVVFAPGGGGQTPGSPAFALRCPAGWNVRGIKSSSRRGWGTIAATGTRPRNDFFCWVDREWNCRM